jgi:glycosyltransferase involved in cell wall biosynthesis
MLPLGYNRNIFDAIMRYINYSIRLPVLRMKYHGLNGTRIWAYKHGRRRLSKRCSLMPLSFAVVICSFELARINDLDEAIRSVLGQSYKDSVNLVICIDGNAKLHYLVARRYNKLPRITVIKTNDEKPIGLAQSRNLAMKRCSQDVVCFLDDDAVAHHRWIEELAESFIQHESPLVVGRVLPLWRARQPRWLSPAFYWLVGSTGSIFDGHGVYVKSGFGSNLACSRVALERAGYFVSSLGKRGRSLLQAEDTELGIRISESYGVPAIYNRQAIVFHKVDREKLDKHYLIKRAYFQGKSKALLFMMHGRNISSLSTESSYIRTTVARDLVGTLKGLFSPSDIVESLERLTFSVSVVFTVIVAFFIQILEHELTSGFGKAAD